MTEPQYRLDVGPPLQPHPGRCVSTLTCVQSSGRSAPRKPHQTRMSALNLLGMQCVRLLRLSEGVSLSMLGENKTCSSPRHDCIAHHDHRPATARRLPKQRNAFSLPATSPVVPHVVRELWPVRRMDGHAQRNASFASIDYIRLDPSLPPIAAPSTSYTRQDEWPTVWRIPWPAASNVQAIV